MAAPCFNCGVQLQIHQKRCGSCGYWPSVCAHAECPWDCCVYTPYVKRRRVLRSTRNTMRVMRDVLEGNDLMSDFEEALELTGLPHVELDEPQDGPGEADESSDVEDETVALRAIVAARSEADVLHQLVNSAASLAERDRLRAENAHVQAESARVQAETARVHAENARLQAELDALRQI